MRSGLIVLLLFGTLALLAPSLFAGPNSCNPDSCTTTYNDCNTQCERDYGQNSSNRGQPISPELEVKCSGSHEQAYEENKQCYDESGTQFTACTVPCEGNQACIDQCLATYDQRNAEVCGPIYLDKCYQRCTTQCSDQQNVCRENCSTAGPPANATSNATANETVLPPPLQPPVLCNVEIQRIYDGVAADGVSDITFTAVPSGEYDVVDITVEPLPGDTLRGRIEKPDPTTVVFTPDEADATRNYLVPQTAVVRAWCIPQGGNEADRVERTEAFTIEQPPLFFVHGFNSDASVWVTFEGRADREGWQHEHINYPGQQDIAISAQQLAREIQEFLNRIKGGAFYDHRLINANQVDIVAHSMGGLVTRSYIAGNYQGDIRKFIMLGTPNHGAWDAKPADLVMGGLAVQQLKPDSAFLRELNRHSRNPDIEYHTIAGTGWFTIIGPAWGTWRGDGLVSVESVQLPEVPLYCTYDAHTTAVYWIAPIGPSALVYNGGGWTTSQGGTLPTSDAAYGIARSAILTGTATTVAGCESSAVLVEDIDLADPSSQVVVTVHSPVTLHAYDAQGHHVGINASGDIENEIGQGVFYSTDPGYETIRIVGNKTVLFTVVGQAPGTFDLDVARWDPQSNVTTQTFESVDTAPGVVYIVNATGTRWELARGEEQMNNAPLGGIPVSYPGIQPSGISGISCAPALLLLAVAGWAVEGVARRKTQGPRL